MSDDVVHFVAPDEDDLMSLRKALEDNRAEMQAARAEREKEFRTIASLETWGEVSAALQRVTQGMRVPNLGGYGTIEQTEQTVSIDLVASCPYRIHRWESGSNAVNQRKRSILRNPFKQIDPIIVTPIERNDPLFANDPRAELMVVDGEGTLQAMRELRDSHVRVKVILSLGPLHHGPLQPHEAVYYQLTKTASPRHATKMQLVMAILRARSSWEQMNLMRGTHIPFPLDEQIAELTGVAWPIVAYARQVSEQPPQIFAYHVEGLLSDRHVISLHQMLVDPQQRVRVAQYIADKNRVRLDTGRPLLPGRAIKTVRDQLFPELSTTDAQLMS